MSHLPEIPHSSVSLSQIPTEAGLQELKIHYRWYEWLRLIKEQMDENGTSITDNADEILTLISDVAYHAGAIAAIADDVQELLDASGGNNLLVPTTIIGNTDTSGNYVSIAAIRNGTSGTLVENAGALGSDTYETVLNLTSKAGYVNYLAWGSSHNDTTSKVVTMRVTIDGTQVFEGASDTLSSANRGCILLGSNSSGSIDASEDVYFSDSFKVEIKSSTALSGSGEIYIRYKAQYKSV